jgi:tetratricopeptide (TPR) repeat protein
MNSRPARAARTFKRYLLLLFTHILLLAGAPAATSDQQNALNAALRLAEEGKQQQAQRALEAILFKAPGYLDALLAHGRISLAMGDFKKAAISCDAILRKDSDHEQALLCHSMALAGSGLVDAALGELKEAGRVNPHSSEAWRLRAQLLEKRGDTQKALEEANHGLVIDPSDVAAQSLKGEILAVLGRFDEARDVCSNILNSSPERGSCLLTRATSLFELHDPEGALRDATAALAPASGVPENPARKARARALLELGKAQEALGDLDIVIGSQASDFDARVLRARAYRKLSRPADAAVDLTVALSSYPSRLLLRERAETWQEAGDFEKAIEDWSAALAREPNDTEALLARGRLFDLVHQPEKARADLVATVRLDPAAGGLNSKCLMEPGSPTEKVARCTELIEINPAYPPLHRARGDACLTAKDWKCAIEDYTFLETSSTNDATLYFNRGIARYASHAPGALEDLSKAIELDPSAAGAWAQRGEVYRSAENSELAARDYQRAIALDPHTSAAIRFHYAMILASREENVKATEQFSAGLTEEPDDFNALTFAAEALLKLNRLAEAHTYLDRAIRIKADYAPAYALRARMYSMLGAADAYRSDLEKYEKFKRLGQGR